ncbi:MFS transporter [Deinococcus lacus]|uniref:MFS transporter n=1 Tax=Deinococcus lacus TaxID=392561 RepID=A0ABW1YE80_9DEIO
MTTPAPRTVQSALTAIFFMNGLLFSTWAVNLPEVRDRLSLSEGDIGLSLLAAGAGSLLTMPLTGHWVTRWGSHRVTSLTALLSAGSLALPFLASTFPPLLAALILLGACNGALDVAMNAQGVTAEKALGRPIMSRLHAGYSLGGLTGASIGSFFIGQMAPSQHGLLVAACIAGAALWASPRLLPDRSKPPQRPVGQPPRQRLEPATALLGSLCFLGMLAEGANYDWSVLYFRDVLNLPGGQAGLGYAAFVGCMTLGRLFGDSWRARLGDLTLVRGGGSLTATGLALALLWPQPLPALLGFALAGLGLSNVVPVLYGVAGHALAGRGIAQVATLGYGGFLLGPPVIGWLAEQSSLGAAFWLAAFAAALVAAWAGPTLQKLGETSPG